MSNVLIVHLEGTWPNTSNALRETFGKVPEREVRAMLGETASTAFGFDPDALNAAAARVGPKLQHICG